MKHKMRLFLSAALSAIVLWGCDKDDDPIPQANVMVVHASPNAPAVDIRVNNAVAKTNLAYPTNTGYLQVNAGATNLKVSPATTTTYVIDANVTLDANKNYSVFALDSVSKIKAAVVVDDLTAPAAGKAHVRFFHLSPNAPAVDIAVTGGPVVFGNRAFNDQATANYTAFTPLNAASYNLEVRVAGTSTVVLSLPNIALQAGKIYTVFAKGFVGGAGSQALGAEIIVHN
ncbi:MAG TPA: DUF4397 domain-containing protein [Chitinophagaceae bacterium]